MEPESLTDAELDAGAAAVVGVPTERERAIRAILLGVALGAVLAALGRRR
jgi:hypothetical protein